MNPTGVGTKFVFSVGVVVNLAHSPSSPPSAWIHPWIGRTFSGRYRIDVMVREERGTTVFEGRDLRSSERIEVTCYEASVSLQRRRRKRLQRELKQLRQLRHDHILPILDVGETDAGALYVVTPRLGGESLRDRLYKQRPTSDQAIRMLGQAAAALASVHSANIVHGDLSPDQIVLEHGDHVRLVGFARRDLTPDWRGRRGTGATWCAAEYEAPELSADNTTPIGPTADQFSLAVIALEIICGAYPLSPERALMANDGAWEAIRPGLLSDLSPDVKRVFTRALSLDPNRRYPCLRTFVGALGAALLVEREERPPESTRSSFPLAASPTNAVQDEDDDGPTVLVHEREAATVVRAPRPTMPYEALMTRSLAERLDASAGLASIRSVRPISSADSELSPEAAFVCSCIGAEIGVDELVDICPFERDTCVSHLEQLERLGIIAISSSVVGERAARPRAAMTA